MAFWFDRKKQLSTGFKLNANASFITLKLMLIDLSSIKKMKELIDFQVIKEASKKFNPLTNYFLSRWYGYCNRPDIHF